MIDIIIPAYNAHDTIHSTLSSIIMQRLASMVDVYIIDDCSENGYDDIVKLYKSTGKIHSINLFVNDKNMGPGYSRNRGIFESKRLSNNPWIMFLDSDDTLYSPHSINQLLYYAKENPGCALISMACLYESIPFDRDNIDKNISTYLNVDIVNCDRLTFHGKLYSRKRIESSGLFIPNTRSNEDVSFNMAYIALNKHRIIKMDDNTPVECIMMNPNSVTHSPNSTRSLNIKNFNHIWDWYNANVSCIKQLLDICDKKNISLDKKELGLAYLDDLIYKYTLCYSPSKHLRDADENEFMLQLFYKYYIDIIMSFINSSDIDRLIVTIGSETIIISDLVKNELASSYNKESFEQNIKKHITDKAYYSE